MNGTSSGHNKSYTISGHSRQRSQPETYNGSSSNHQSPQPIYAQHQRHNGHHQRPASSYYESYEVSQNSLIQGNNHNNGGGGGSSGGSKSQHSSPRKMSAPSPPQRPQWNGGGGVMHMTGGSMRGMGSRGSGSSNGPYVTQVQISSQPQAPSKHFQHGGGGYTAGGGAGSTHHHKQPAPMPSASKV